MSSSVLLLGITLGFLLVFGGLVAWTYRRGAEEEREQPKYRMLEGDESPQEEGKP